jgi:quinol monooxygenase YgiN
MEFQKDKAADFKALFDTKRDQIASQDGCLHIELLQDKKDENIFFTYSIWVGEEYLEKYRHSAFFKATWKMTKAMFLSPALAWSTAQLYNSTNR